MKQSDGHFDEMYLLLYRHCLLVEVVSNRWPSVRMILLAEQSDLIGLDRATLAQVILCTQTLGEDPARIRKNGRLEVTRLMVLRPAQGSF